MANDLSRNYRWFFCYDFHNKYDNIASTITFFKTTNNEIFILDKHRITQVITNLMQMHLNLMQQMKKLNIQKL